MDDAERRQYESLLRVQKFGSDNTGAIKINAKAVAAFASVSADVTALETTGANRVSATGAKTAGTANKTAARIELQADVRAISRTANTIAEEEPDFDDKFDLPRTNFNQQTLLETARAFAKDAAPVKAKFIEYGLPADFIDDLNADITEFETASGTQDSGNRTKIAATTDTDEILKRATQTKRTLDTIIRNIYRDNPAKLADWTSATHVERAPRTKKTPAPPKP